MTLSYPSTNVKIKWFVMKDSLKNNSKYTKSLFKTILLFETTTKFGVS